MTETMTPICRAGVRLLSLSLLINLALWLSGCGGGEPSPPAVH